MSLLVALADLAGSAVRVFGLALLAGAVAAIVDFLYESYARQRMPAGLAVLVGLGTVGLWLNTATALQQYLGSGDPIPSPAVAFVNVAAFCLGSVAAVAGARVGGRLAVDAAALSGASALDGEVSRLVRTVGRFTTVELPETVDDIDGYEPVAAETKAALAGKTLRFPRGLTVAQLSERLADRLRDDYGVGRVDADVDETGSVSYLALGGRVAGVGPTLPAGTVAVAVRADPSFGASPGDLVQVWRTREAGEATDAGAAASGPERIATAELRAAVGDVATLAVGADNAADLDPDAEYRLATLPTEPQADREFGARLRAADETVGAVTVAAGSPLDGTPVSALDASVVAVEREGSVETLPTGDRLLGAGDVLYVLARPDRLRTVETAAGAAGESTTGASAGGTGPRST
ncbi:TrkA C-terminal domain-containing protein [Halorussus marinus]|uniref:TrkA C-terminal domain-containing protein n=1 Tax=Halorussus marinus TaxID=2505976 RepID=UPI001091AAE7|nr:TrkA C-terminal domain-containing protein [Halorussus marinus]